MLYLNLGCGSRFHPDWTNVDLVAYHPYVQAHDLRQGLPFPDNTFDVLYHSHLLEHFPRSEAARFLCECSRVLKPGGIIRVAVPDLERMVKLYLYALRQSLLGEKDCQHNYEWIMLELYDQAVREQAGGDMALYLKGDLPNRDFVLKRCGIEAGDMISKGVGTGHLPSTLMTLPSSLVHMVRHLTSILRSWFVKNLLGDEYELLRLGRFRRSGEVHLWMYDRYSLAKLLQDVGFVMPRLVGPCDSRIPRWVDYHLDAAPDGTVYKPDSLYMEAVKP